MNVLDIRDLRVEFPRVASLCFVAVDDVTLTVDAGKILGGCR